MMSTAASTAAAEKPPRRFPPPCWTQDEALALIQAYRDRWYALRRGYLRTADWDAVAEEVGRICPGAVPPKTSAQCRHKMEKLRQRYRAEKQRALSFPAGAGAGQFLSTWFYFEAMDSMEKNGNGSGSNPDEETDLNSGCVKIVNSKINHELNTNVDSIYGGLNPGRGIRFKPVAADGNLVTIATRSNNFRVSNSYGGGQEEDNDDEIEDGYCVETPIGKNLGKTPKSISQNYGGSRFQSDHVHLHPSSFQELEHSMVRPRKFSKTGSNSNHGYWTENGQVHDHDDGFANDDEAWMKKPGFKERFVDRADRIPGHHHYFDGENGSGEFSREKQRGVKRDNDDSIGQIVSSIKLLADGFVKMEKMKMDMVYEIEKRRMEAEMKRNEMLLESQKQILEAFVKGLAENKKQQQQQQ